MVAMRQHANDLGNCQTITSPFFYFTTDTPCVEQKADQHSVTHT